MSDRTRGTVFVILQFVLLAVLVLAPIGSLWALEGVIGFIGWALEVVGFVILVAAFVSLGSALTAHPMPKRDNRLRTSGLYAVVRHPIYLGLLVLALGVAIRGASWIHLVAFGALAVVLHVKAGFEERLLRETYPEYDEYARRVGRLTPRVRRGSGKGVR